MLKRLNIYFKEMYPIIPRLFLAVLLFFEMYFIVLLNYGVKEFTLGIQEAVGVFTIFTFLMFLRIADDFKDYELDCKLFNKRPLPSGRVKKKDLKIVLAITLISTIILNVLFMNNIIFFILLYSYGFLMSVWFFQKTKIQKNLLLAVVTHNPVQLFINLYTISYAYIKYGLTEITGIIFLGMLTLYFPALLWEVSRKIRAPKDETEYETYSKIFGYKKATRFVLILTVVDIITNILLIQNLMPLMIIPLVLNLIWMIYKGIKFIKDPTKFKIVDKFEKYTYIQEILMIVTIVIYLVKIGA